MDVLELFDNYYKASSIVCDETVGLKVAMSTALECCDGCIDCECGEDDCHIG